MRWHLAAGAVGRGFGTAFRKLSSDHQVEPAFCLLGPTAKRWQVLRRMLSDIEQQEIEQELSHYEQKRAASIDALKVVQRHRGWVSNESLKDVAALLQMTPAELDNAATFYNLIFRRPVGRHVILLCDSVSCWVMGCNPLIDHLRQRLGIRPGETTSDRRFTLLPNACLGICDHAPAMMIDEDLHVDLTAEKLDTILDRYP